MKWQSALAFAVGAGAGFVLMLYITLNKVGPRIMWASDACPEPGVTCGVMPAGALLSAFVGAVVTLGVGGALHKYTATGVDTA